MFAVPVLPGRGLDQVAANDLLRELLEEARRLAKA